jgi:hypothetical protein
MKYAVGIGSGDIHTNFHNDWFRHSKLTRRIRRHTTYIHHGDGISLLLFFSKYRM